MIGKRYACAIIRINDEHLERVIHPYGVQQLEGVYYIDAFCEHRKAERRFRLDRIEELKTVGEWFKPDPTYRERLAVGGTSELIRDSIFEGYGEVVSNTNNVNHGIQRRNIEPGYRIL